MTDEELAYLETCDLLNNEAARKLVAEIRSLKARLSEKWTPFNKPIYVEHPCTCDTQGVYRCLASFQAHQKPKPRPMCKPDPLGDLMPPARNERGDK